MAIQIWNSYSCNNSSSFRLVAKFANPIAASEVAAELRRFFPEHAEEIDARDDYSEEPSEAQRAFAVKHGLTWGESMYWGDGGLVGDEPEVFVRGELMIVQHTYCGGFGELSSVIEKLGATSTDEQDSRAVGVSLLFRVPPAITGELDRELTDLFAQLDRRKTERYAEIKAPWAEHETWGDCAWFRDPGAIGIYLPVDPRDLDNLDRWLADRAIDRPSLQIEDHRDLATFTAIATARCTACNAQLEYLDPRLHDIEHPQLVCRPCGGLYEVATFLSKQ